MTRSRYDVSFDAPFLKLRDERTAQGGGQWILSSVRRAYSEASQVSFGDLLEKVCEPGEAPSQQARRSHELSVEAFRKAVLEGRTKGVLEGVCGGVHLRNMEFVNAAYQSILTLGCHTFPYAHVKLPDACSRNLEETVQTLCAQSYVLVDGFLDPKHLADFVDEARSMHENGKMEPADPHQATSGQRDDYISWLDETRVGMPAITRTIQMLKALAHAFSPSLSHLDGRFQYLS